MNRIGTLLIGLLLVGAPAGAGAAGFTKQDLDAQLKLFLAWHQGRYDNHSQLLRQSGGPLATPVTAPVYRLHTVYLPIDMPEFGPHVLYVEEYKNNDIAQNARIRLYSITADEKEQAVRIKIWMPLKPEPLIGSLRDLSKVKQLTKADMRMFRDVCDVWMYWTGNAFIGGMKDRSCDREDWWYDYDVAVGPEHQWQRDRGRKLANSDEIVWSLAPGVTEVWFEQAKAHPYTCRINASRGGDARQDEAASTVELLDRGGEADVTAPNGQIYSLLLQRWSPTVPSSDEQVQLLVREKGGVAPPTVAQSQAYGRRVTAERGAITVDCTRK
jgi:hypothetical protein